LTFRFDKLTFIKIRSHRGGRKVFSPSTVHTEENSQILTVSNKKSIRRIILVMLEEGNFNDA
jgi:hypothetical protein